MAFPEGFRITVRTITAEMGWVFLSRNVKVNRAPGENVENLIRRFKKSCEKAGIIKMAREKQYFEKPTEVRKRKERQRLKRIAKLQALR